ncbi:hypothetical protein K504DRAFT_491616 [Pleomassaria siparia CBS 279.74]|uniref:Uncharacterized protein n=1 Tax=Pleomassaria siparia CBS 279.74 TaxID=1314801 RepID=A0A6G1K7Y1_9PLEO|nr:hypothetical protein K504DRAFT_491616 [Pleomassaria siparia CBS 279.74]
MIRKQNSAVKGGAIDVPTLPKVSVTRAVVTEATNPISKADGAESAPVNSTQVATPDINHGAKNSQHMTTSAGTLPIPSIPAVKPKKVRKPFMLYKSRPVQANTMTSKGNLSILGRLLAEFGFDRNTAPWNMMTGPVLAVRLRRMQLAYVAKLAAAQAAGEANPDPEITELDSMSQEEIDKRRAASQVVSRLLAMGTTNAVPRSRKRNRDQRDNGVEDVEEDMAGLSARKKVKVVQPQRQIQRCKKRTKHIQPEYSLLVQKLRSIQRAALYDISRELSDGDSDMSSSEDELPLTVRCDEHLNPFISRKAQWLVRDILNLRRMISENPNVPTDVFSVRHQAVSLFRKRMENLKSEIVNELGGKDSEREEEAIALVNGFFACGFPEGEI